MEIREHGNRWINNKYSEPKKAVYKCAACGCVFAADINTECKTQKYNFGLKLYECKCPECGEPSLSSKTE